MSDPSPFAVNAMFRDLVVEAELGSGAFGTVYRAHDPLIGRRVALKVIRSGGLGAVSAEAERRFLREARALGALSHPNVTALHRVHTLEDGGFALELEFAEGGSYEPLLADGRRLPADEALVLLRGVASGLRAAHAAHITHGDVKPANVLRAKDGTVKLVDFGLARVLDADAAASSAGARAGTPHYLAPEIIEGGTRSPASDVWSLGALVYKALSGRHPFDAESLAGLFFRVLNTEPLPLPDSIPAPLSELVLACLAKRPGDRPALDDEFFRRLESPRAPVAPFDVPAVVLTAPRRIVGREQELSKVREAMKRAAEGTVGVVGLLGAAGVGKSRIAAAIAQEAKARGFAVVLSRATAEEGVLRPLFRELVRVGQGSDAARRVLDAPPGPGEAIAHVGHVGDRIAAIASERAIVLVIDDLNRASEEDVRTLRRLVARLEGVKALLVLTERFPDPGGPTDAAARIEPLLADGGLRVDVGPMPRDALARVLSGGGDEEPPADLVERAVSRAAGNPLFALHLLSHAMEARSAARAAGVSEGAVSSGSETPAVLRDLLVRRVRGLPDELREVLDVAAVDGVVFDAENVALALDAKPRDVLRRLQRLSHRAGLVEALDRGHRFAHPLLQEVVYAEVAPDLRRDLHGAYARALETRGGSVDPERLGGHWEHAGDLDRARPHLLRAARAALTRSEVRRALDLGMRGGVVPEHVTPDLVSAHANAVLEVAAAFGEVGRQRERDAIFDEIDRIAEQRGDGALRLRVHARRSLSRFLGSGLAPGDEERVRAAAVELPECVEKGIAWYVTGLVERYAERLDAARSAFEQAARRFQAFGAVGRLGATIDQLGSLALSERRVRDSIVEYRRAANVCRAGGRIASAEISEVNAICGEVLLGRIDGVEAALERAARLVEADGGVVPAARIRVVRARVLYGLGELSRARAIVQGACETLDRLGSKAGSMEARSVAAELACAAGDWASAGAHRARGRESAEALGAARELLHLDALEACAAHHEGREADARRIARAVLQRARCMPAEITLDSELAPVCEALATGLGVGADELPAPTARVEPTADTRFGDAVRAALRAAAGRDAVALEAAAAVVEREDAGERRALLRVLGLRWRAIAAAIRGIQVEAERLCDEALLAGQGFASLATKRIELPFLPTGAPRRDVGVDT